jgi:predicted nucleic acid-binding protein
MTDLPPIVIMDTCILLELLNVPKHNEHHSEITEEFERLEDIGADLILPMAAIIETGNHIADLPHGHDRRTAATRYVAAVREAIQGDAPWQTTQFPDNQAVLAWLDQFPDHASNKAGFSDASIIQEWERLRGKCPMSRVYIWSNDGKFISYDTHPDKIGTSVKTRKRKK